MDETKQRPSRRRKKTFESNANSKAASELPATGVLPLPSQMARIDRFRFGNASLCLNQGGSHGPAQRRKKIQSLRKYTADSATASSYRSGATVMLTARPTPPIQPLLPYAGASAIRLSAL
jgi:hypothetical protein